MMPVIAVHNHLTRLNSTRRGICNNVPLFCPTPYRTGGEPFYVDILAQAPQVCDLHPDAYRSLVVDNAGGKSSVSEAVSIDRFARLFGATQVLVEKEVEYWIDYKMVDYVCTVDQQRVGVSVTRAMSTTDGKSLDLTPGQFTLDDAIRLLNKKLYGLIVSRNGVSKRCRFYRSILHIWAASDDIAHTLTTAWTEGHVNVSEFGLDVKGVVGIWITVCPDPTIYLNQYHHDWIRQARSAEERSA
jgi:hypothetical protein